MRLAHRWADRNLTRLEGVTAWLLIAVFIAYFIHRVLIVFATAERTSVFLTINNMNTALKYTTSLKYLERDHEYMQGLTLLNPVSLVYSGTAFYSNKTGKLELNDQIKAGSDTTVMDNYLGELDSPDPGTLQKGHWYFDTTNKTLVYLVRNDEYFHSDLPGPARLRFKIDLKYGDTNENGQFDSRVDQFETVSIKNVDIYEWDI